MRNVKTDRRERGGSIRAHGKQNEGFRTVRRKPCEAQYDPEGSRKCPLCAEHCRVGHFRCNGGQAFFLERHALNRQKTANLGIR